MLLVSIPITKPTTTWECCSNLPKQCQQPVGTRRHLQKWITLCRNPTAHRQCPIHQAIQDVSVSSKTLSHLSSPPPSPRRTHRPPQTLLTSRNAVGVSRPGFSEAMLVPFSVDQGVTWMPEFPAWSLANPYQMDRLHQNLHQSLHPRQRHRNQGRCI